MKPRKWKDKQKGETIFADNSIDTKIIGKHKTKQDNFVVNNESKTKMWGITVWTLKFRRIEKYL